MSDGCDRGFADMQNTSDHCGGSACRMRGGGANKKPTRRNREVFPDALADAVLFERGERSTTLSSVYQISNRRHRDHDGMRGASAGNANGARRDSKDGRRPDRQQSRRGYQA